MKYAHLFYLIIKDIREKKKKLGIVGVTVMCTVLLLDLDVKNIIWEH